MALNGALGGLVAVTAEPFAPSPAIAVFVGAIGGVLVVLSVPLLDKLEVDDVVGAIPVHLVAGIWGTIAVVFSNGDASLVTQIIGIVAIGAFVLVTTGIVWTILKMTIGIRASEEEEFAGSTKPSVAWKPIPSSDRARNRCASVRFKTCRLPDGIIPSPDWPGSLLPGHFL